MTSVPRERLERKTEEFVQRPYALNVFPIPTEAVGDRELHVTLGEGPISMPSMKKARDGEAVIFRLLNNTPDAVSSDLFVNGERVSLSFGKYEVKTLLYRNGELTEQRSMLAL